VSMASDSCCNDQVVDRSAVTDPESSTRAKREGFDRFFVFCLLDMVKHRTVGAGRWKKAAERRPKKLANIGMSAEVLHKTLIPFSLAECSARSASSSHRRGMSPRRQLSSGYARGGGDGVRRHRGTCEYNGDPLVRISTNEGSYRASSTCTRGGSRQTRMYRS
jgi:hypothetical protein